MSLPVYLVLLLRMMHCTEKVMRFVELKLYALLVVIQRSRDIMMQLLPSHQISKLIWIQTGALFLWKTFKMVMGMSFLQKLP